MLPSDPNYSRVHHDFNRRLYVAAAVFAAFTATCGDPILMANLGLKIGAPNWLKVLPGVAAMTLSYVTVIFMGWWMTPAIPRRKAFFFTVGPTYASYLLLAGALWLNLPPEQLRVVMVVTVLTWAFIDGFSMLPCVDLLARACPKERRASLMSLTNAITFGTMIAVSMFVAWLMGEQSPLRYPYNFAACLTAYSIAGIASTAVLLPVREQMPAVDVPREPARDYIRDLLAIVREDHAFRAILLVACLGAMLQSIGPVVLVYAQTHRGFGDAQVAQLIAIKPWTQVAFSLGGVWLAHRLGSMRMAMIPVALVGLAAVLAPVLDSTWQVVAQLMAGLSSQIYAFMLLVVMHHSPPARNTRYLTVYYVLAIVPGLFPLALSGVVENHPTAALMLIVAVAGVVLTMLVRLHRATPHEVAPE